MNEDGFGPMRDGCTEKGARAADAFARLFWIVGAAIVVVLVGLAVFGGAR